MIGGMASSMVKTSVTVLREDLAEAHRLGINVSELVRDALRARLREEEFEGEVSGYVAAFADWDERAFDHLAGEGLG